LAARPGRGKGGFFVAAAAVAPGTNRPKGAALESIGKAPAVEGAGPTAIRFSLMKRGESRLATPRGQKTAVRSRAP